MWSCQCHSRAADVTRSGRQVSVRPAAPSREGLSYGAGYAERSGLVGSGRFQLCSWIDLAMLRLYRNMSCVIGCTEVTSD